MKSIFILEISTGIPYYPHQAPSHPPMYCSTYPPSGQYYYPPSEMIPYYYPPPPPTYPNSQQSYAYSYPSTYYNPLTSYPEQYNYYYNQQTSYNSPNDIPVTSNHLVHQTYRRNTSHMQT